MAKSIVLEVKCDRCGEIVRVGTDIHDDFAMQRFVQYQFSTKEWFDGDFWNIEDLCPDCLRMRQEAFDAEIPF